MSDFKKAIAHTQAAEGGYVDHPNDHGGATNYGVSLRLMQTLGSKWDLNGDGKIDAADIKLLTPEHAQEIFKDVFWTPNKYDMISNQAIATKVFDLAVNAGSSRANKLLQEAINYAYPDANIVADGKIGSKTINALEHITVAQKRSVDFIAVFSSVIARFYLQLCDNNRTQLSFIRGWCKRALNNYGG